jgi:hypothetical protein
MTDTSESHTPIGAGNCPPALPTMPEAVHWQKLSSQMSA